MNADQTSSLVLSVDWEDFYHICDVAPYADPESWSTFPSRIEANTERLLAMLETHSSRATFFVIGRLADRYPDLINRIIDGGHEVAWHGETHHTWQRLPPDRMIEEWFTGLERLQQRFSISIKGFRAPMWSLNPQLIDDFAEKISGLGLRYDASLVPLAVVGDTRYPRLPTQLFQGFYELPPTIVSFFGIAAPISMSWGFRWLPWSYVRWQMNRRITGDGYGMIAIHPWELDPEQPKLKLSRGIYFSHYAGLANTRKRLAYFLKNHGTIGCDTMVQRLEKAGKTDEFKLC